ncbi:MAG: saccharopine dehydrogenase, partial [Actinobacteria bacterium]|nr:saccharopine dehydrogenase [Actinomycetota bacterium]
KLLLPKWKLDIDEKEFTVMRMIVQGQEKSFTWDMSDYFDEESHLSSMARTTGFTCTAIAGLVLDGAFARKGICPPEFIGAEQTLFEKVLQYLRQRKIDYRMKEN